MQRQRPATAGILREAVPRGGTRWSADRGRVPTLVLMSGLLLWTATSSPTSPQSAAAIALLSSGF